MSGQTNRPPPRLAARPRCAAITSLVPDDSIRTLDWSDDGYWIALGSDDGSLHLLGCPTDLSIQRLPQAAYSYLLDAPNRAQPESPDRTGYWVNQVAIGRQWRQPDGCCWIVTVTDHGHYYVHSVQTIYDREEQALSCRSAKVTEHVMQSSGYQDLRVAWAPDARHFCLNGNDGEGGLFLWPFDGSEPSRVPERLGKPGNGPKAPDLLELRWSPRGDWLAGMIVGEDNRPRALLFSVRSPNSHGERILGKDKECVRLIAGCDWNCLGFSPNGDRLGFGSLGGEFIWIEMNSDFRILAQSGAHFCRTNQLGLTHDGAVNCLDWSPDGRLVATGGDDQTILLWDTAHGQAFCRIGGFHEPISALCFSPDGRFLVVDNNNDSTLAGDEKRLCPGLIEINVNPDEDPLYPRGGKPAWLP